MDRFAEIEDGAKTDQKDFRGRNSNEGGYGMTERERYANMCKAIAHLIRTSKKVRETFSIENGEPSAQKMVWLPPFMIDDLENLARLLDTPNCEDDGSCIPRNVKEDLE